MGPIAGLVIGKVIEAALPAIIDRVRRDPKATAKDILPAVVHVAKQAASNDPTVVNAMNGEKPHQSRVVMGSLLALIGGGFMGAAQLYAMFEAGSFDPEMAGASLAAILGAGWALYGRLKSGLKPLFSRKG